MKVKWVLKHGVLVCSNEKMDKLRQKECLCLNCKRMGNCDLASGLYRLCKEGSLALAVTRCPNWGKK